MNELKKHIDLQIEFNRGKNLFHKDFYKTMKFTGPTLTASRQLSEVAPEQLERLIDYTTGQVLQEFCRLNQYFSFKDEDVLFLKNAYINLYKDIVKKTVSSETISKIHYENLRNWIKTTNPFSERIYANQEAVLSSVTCAEYSAELQKNILCLNQFPLMEPILDIGCGKEGHLVKSLRSAGFDASGIDRFANGPFYLQKADWLHYDYGTEKWGTIISNLGFSNHFIHNHLRDDGNFTEYAQKYMEILKALKTRGSFFYAPDVPFIEQYLDTESFSIKKHDIKNSLFKTTVIKRLK